MAIAPILQRRSMQRGHPPGGFSNDRHLRAAMQGLYAPGSLYSPAPDESPVIPALPFYIPALASHLSTLSGVKFMWGQGPAGNWPDLLNSDDLVPQAGAVYNGSYANFDGTNDYFSTAATPVAAAGFAGVAADGESWNGSGITVIAVLCIRPGNLVGRVLMNWDHSDYGEGVGHDNTLWLVRFNLSGQLEFWNRYAIDGVTNQPSTYLYNPPSDRFFAIPVDFRNYDGLGHRLDDGRWHLFQFSRGTTEPGAEERKLIYIDGRQVYYSGTGNGINGFSDFDVPLTVGKAFWTPIAGDPAFLNFSGQIAFFAVRNHWTGVEAMQTSWYRVSNSRYGSYTYPSYSF